MSSITSNFNEIKELIEEGITLVPTTKNKIPLTGWQKIDKPFDVISFWDLIDKTNANGIAYKTGMVSGNLICLDIDTKHYAGFDAILFETLKVVYVDIWERLRIEKTPSGGFHILYRLEEFRIDSIDNKTKINNLVKSCNLVSRPKTQEELISDSGNKNVCFLELKAELMLCQSYPSIGYIRIQNGIKGKLAVLTWEEHMSLISLCKTYDETIKVEDTNGRKNGISKDKDDFYEVGNNPFEHFDKSIDAENILDEYGWEFLNSKGKYVYYQKPDKKTKGVSASFNLEKRLYKVFTSNSQEGVEPKAYTPSRLLGALKYGGDMKQAYYHLVKEGYGKIKKSIEQRIIKNKAQYGGELPANISVEAKNQFEQEKTKLGEKYPYGIFWEETNVGAESDSSAKYKINRERLYVIAESLGFRMHGNDICLIGGNVKDTLYYVVELIDERRFFDELKNYIKEDYSTNDGEEIKNCYESFLQKSGKFTISRLKILDETLLLRSTKEVSYKAYKNGFVIITSNEIKLQDYELIEEKLIWKHQIQDREFYQLGNEDLDEQKENDFPKIVKKGLYYDFLEKALGKKPEKHKDLLRCLGYYAHDYKSTTTPYIVVLCEQCEDAKNGGGSGKNIFTNLLRYTTSLLNKPGDNVKFDDTLLRTHKGQKVLSLNDLPKKFNFLGLKEYASGEAEVGKKFVQEITLSNRDLPKFICNTNFSFDPSLPGLKRRLIALEFTSFFILKGGVDAYYKKDFPGDKGEYHDWDLNDWICFDFIIMKAIQEFLISNCKLSITELTDSGWVKQFEQRFRKTTLMFIRENINEWLELKEVNIATTFRIQYENFCKENDIERNWKLSSTAMNEALEEYCSHHGIEFIKHRNIGKNSITHMQENVKVFTKIGQDAIASNVAKDDVPF